MTTNTVRFRCDRCADVVFLPANASVNARRCVKCGAVHQREFIEPDFRENEKEETERTIPLSVLFRAQIVWRCAIAAGLLAGLAPLVAAYNEAQTSFYRESQNSGWFGLLLLGVLGFCCYVIVFYIGCLLFCPKITACIVETEVHNSPHGQHYKTRYVLTDNANFNFYLERYIQASHWFGYLLSVVLLVFTFWLISRRSS